MKSLATSTGVTGIMVSGPKGTGKTSSPYYLHDMLKCQTNLNVMLRGSFGDECVHCLKELFPGRLSFLHRVETQHTP